MINAGYQYVEFSGFDANEEEDGVTPNGEDLDLYLPSPNPGKGNPGEGKSLEVLLSTKNKRLQEELTKLRVRFQSFSVVFPNSACRYFTGNWRRH